MNLLHKEGFSLIELMVVIAIVAILAAVAVPAYKQYTLKAKTATLMPILKESINQAQQYRDKNGSFPGNFNLLPNLPTSPSVQSVQVFNGDSFAHVCTSDPGAVGSVEVDASSALDSSFGVLGIMAQIYNIGGADVVLCQYFYAYVGGPTPGTETDLINGCENMYADGFAATAAIAKTSALFAQACPGG